MIHRRDFLAAAASTGVALGAPASIKSASSVNASDTVVIGIMGLSRGRALAVGFQAVPSVEVAYVCDVDQDRAGTGADEIGKRARKAPKVVQDFRRILDDQAVDALIVATPNHWHAPATIAACAAGKHVYVEKPCSHNPGEGEIMIAAARKHKRHVQMGVQRRSTQHFTDAIREIHDGAIGRAFLAQSWYTNNRPSIGRGKLADVPKELEYDLWQGPAPRRPYVVHQPNNQIHYSWHWLWHWGNGELGNNGVHALDVCRWGLQADYPTRVVSSGGHYCHQDDQETPDTNFVAFEFGDNKSATWEGLSCGRFQHRRGEIHQGTMVHFHGDKGSLAISDCGYTVFDPHGKEVRVVGNQSPQADYAGFVRSHAANFIRAIRGNEKLTAEIEEGHKSTLLCHLGNIAYRVGRSIRCRPQDGQIMGDADATRLWTREYEPGWEPKV